MGKGVFLWVALLGGFGNRGATGIGKTEDFGDFVEAFADGVVESGADDFKLVVGGHVDYLSVAAGDDQS